MICLPPEYKSGASQNSAQAWQEGIEANTTRYFQGKLSLRREQMSAMHDIECGNFN